MSTPPRKSAGLGALDALVYSTETGRICAQCQHPQTQCRCAEQAAARIRGDGKVVVSRESKGRGGKTVSLVRGLALTDAQLTELAKALKQRCGSGGTVVDGVIEIQGDHRDLLVAELGKRGYSARRHG